MRRISDIVIHCSATAEGRDFTVADIRRWHRAQGWSDIGYHWVIYRDGTIVAGRPEATPGAHVAGYNANSVGIVYIGGCAIDGKTPKDTRTPAQKAAMARLVGEKLRAFPGARVRGHRDFPKVVKACPSFDVASWLKDIGL